MHDIVSVGDDSFDIETSEVWNRESPLGTHLTRHSLSSSPSDPYKGQLLKEGRDIFKEKFAIPRWLHPIPQIHTDLVAC